MAATLGSSEKSVPQLDRHASRCGSSTRRAAAGDVPVVPPHAHEHEHRLELVPFQDEYRIVAGM